MNTLRTLACLSLIASGAAFAAPPAADADAQAQYRKQVESCNNGSSNQDRATCLKEAGAALAEARKGKLDEPNKHYKQNATERCEVLAGDERDACMARMKGHGKVEGSVQSGGELRELRTTKTVPAPAN